VVDVQRRTGVARQTLYNALKRPVGSDLDDLSVLALVAAGAAQTIDALVSITGASHERTRQAISALHRDEHVNVLAGQSGVTDPIGVFTITAKGLTRLQTEIESERVRSHHEDAWTVFIAIPEGRAGDIKRAAEAVLGDDGSFGVVEAAVAPSRMSGPELAVVARALDSRDLMIIVQGLWDRLRQMVDGLSAQAPIVALSPPRS
jgi:hypothetical protein